MGGNSRDYDPRNVADRMRAFLAEPEESTADKLARLEAKIDALHAALVKPQSSIILVGDDIVRIAAAIRASNKEQA